MIALAASLAALLAVALGVLFWQMKRAADASDENLKAVKACAELRILLAASDVALADKERAMNMAIAERDRLEFTVETVEKQRDELLQEALDTATPGATAIAVRNALERLRSFPPKLPDEEALPDLPSE